MDIGQRKKYLIEKLKNKEYRDAFVSEHIDTGIPFQIKTIREQREWTQKQLGENVHETMKQEQISRLEDPNYSKFSLATLKRLASAFDVGLMVRFVPISDLAKWELGLTSESLKAVSFDQDDYFEDKPDEIDASQKVAIAPLTATGIPAEGLAVTVTVTVTDNPHLIPFSLHRAPEVDQPFRQALLV